ncbi:PBSX family phage terminase large subunit [Nonomuraea sp. K274]|uniref:PBSX family phage terminase large subunit n=1 Tax=Nonomuraea cypriaca TaxID=1187855 RepID=A0A931EW49_9ACTN|nr:PBSX family phage terminase large subunit [Nonomuraea cypriaca]MBF8186334.1 PBSX family phage terminase large subunit [Nonomuraea cypriaca]
MISLDAVTAVLSPKQIRSIVGAMDTPQLALWSGAVSSGKTIASLLAFLIAVAAAPDSGLIVVVGRTLQTIERNLIDPLQSPALFGPLAAQVHHTTGSTTAVILGRTVHLVGASDTRAEGRIRGATVALAYVDEATLVPHSFWMMLLSRLRVAGAKLLATTNPDGPGHWMRREFILRAPEVGMRHWHFTLDDNPSLTADYVDRLKAQYTGLWYRRFVAGEWCLAEGVVYDSWDPDTHVVAELPRIDQWISTGIDYGTTNPFHATILGLGADSRLYLTHEYRYDSKIGRRQLTDVEYSERLRTWLSTAPVYGTDLTGISPRYTVVDPSAASFRIQLHGDGVRSVLGENTVLPGIRTVASLLATRRLFVHESCTALINEFPGYSWDEKAAERGEDSPIKADDHGLDAMRYAIQTTQQVWRSRLAQARLEPAA